MSDESKVDTVVTTAESANTVASSGGTETKKGEFVSKEQFSELETQLKEKTERNAEVEKFLEDLSPLLEKLDAQPELVKAITENKLTPELVKSVLEGKVSVTEAKTVVDAHKEVKKEVGKEAYENLSPEKIESLVEAKVKEALSQTETKVEKALSDERQLTELRTKLDSFIKETPDFVDYAQAIDKWFDEHPEQDDIEVAYAVVKGRALAEERRKSDQVKSGETAKEVAANAAGGGSQNTGKMGEKDFLDSLISNKSNPNLI